MFKTLGFDIGLLTSTFLAKPRRHKHPHKLLDLTVKERSRLLGRRRPTILSLNLQTRQEKISFNGGLLSPFSFAVSALEARIIRSFENPSTP